MKHFRWFQSSARLAAIAAAAFLTQLVGGDLRADEGGEADPHADEAGEEAAPDGEPDHAAEAALDAPAVVVTFDGGFVDVGFAGEQAPRFSENFFLRDGRISNWDHFETLMTRIFKKLGVAPSERAVMMSETAGVPRAEREKLTQLMFETFNVPAFYLSVDGVLACYAAGRTSCLAVTGQAATDVIAVYDGYALPHSRSSLPVGRVDVARLAMKLIGDRIGEELAAGDREGVWELLARHGFVAADYDAAMKTAEAGGELEVGVTLPGGREATLGVERFGALEALFKAELIGGEGGVHQAAYSSIMKCDVDLRADLFGHVVLAGRLMTIPGVSERLTKELSALAPPSMPVRIASSSERAHVVWIGASLLANLSTFKQMWVSRKDYDTSGPSIIGKKAF